MLSSEPTITWLTGNSGSGKSTTARLMRRSEVWLDGGSLRKIWPGLGFSKQDRWENNMRAARLANELKAQGFSVIVSTICPYKKLREEIKKLTNCKFIYLDGGKVGKDYPYEL